ncbi:MAG: NAD(P)/FAD-dependent oxidoreductase [Paludibaculum sp.]
MTRDTRFRVETSRGPMESAALVVATGGLSIPKTGATGFGYDLARQFGLAIEPTFPALVPLTFTKADSARWGELSGVSTEVIASHGPQHFREKMLYTHRGLSGPAILQISSYWKPGKPLNLDLLPGTDFSTTVPHEARKQLSLKLPQRLAERWLELEGFTQPVPSVKKIDARLHQWSVLPAGTEGFDKAEVTGGGVSTSELSSQTMEARQGPRPLLYRRGGGRDGLAAAATDFQWAWASAYAAAEALVTGGRARLRSSQLPRDSRSAAWVYSDSRSPPPCLPE